MQPNLTEEMKNNHFHAHLRVLALKTFKNIQRTPTTTVEDILIVFRRKYVKPESSASAKQRFNRLFFDPENQKLPDFLEELQESAEKAFGDNAHQMIENLLYAKMPPHLKKSINQAHLVEIRFLLSSLGQQVQFCSTLKVCRTFGRIISVTSVVSK